MDCAPRFSIIIPCYKVEKYIRECLDSVLTQKYELWEAICVDDGSPDGTGVILDEYAAKDSRIRVIHQLNGGLSAARNTALDCAVGEWLIYLDSDDLLPDGTLSTYAKAIQIYPMADILRGRKINFKDGDKICVPNTSDQVRVVDLSGRVSDFCTTGYFQQHAFKRSTFGDIRYYGASWCEERPYGARCAIRIRVAVDIDSYTYGFRCRQGSITQTHMTLEQFKGYLQATKDVAKTYRDSERTLDQGVIRGIMLVWTEHQIYFLLTHLKPEERKEAWDYWFDSLDDLGCGLPVTGWFRFVRLVCRFSRSHFLACCFCFLPEWLKSHGFHR